MRLFGEGIASQVQSGKIDPYLMDCLGVVQQMSQNIDPIANWACMLPFTGVSLKAIN